MKGKAESYTARDREDLAKVAKTLKTAVRKNMTSVEKLASILAEIEKDTVEAFHQYEFYSERKKRLMELRKALKN